MYVYNCIYMYVSYIYVSYTIQNSLSIAFNICSMISFIISCRTVRSTFAVRETASLGIMGAPRVPPLNPSESIVLSEHYRL